MVAILVIVGLWLYGTACLFAGVWFVINRLNPKVEEMLFVGFYSSIFLTFAPAVIQLLHPSVEIAGILLCVSMLACSLLANFTRRWLRTRMDSWASVIKLR